MNKFGTLKTKILQKFTDAYANGNKSEIKEILKLISENKNFRNLYLFYEEIENKYIQDKKDAELFVEEIVPIVKEHKSKINKFCKELDKKIGDVVITENTVYLYLDKLTENDTLKNVHTKIDARKKLIEHLTLEKEPIQTDPIPVVENETLLHSVLANNFNVLYSSTLSEDDQKQLKQILAISNNELQTNFKTLQEEVSQKLAQLLSEEKNDEAKTKINQALTEAGRLEVSKFNYYKLQQLKNGL